MSELFLDTELGVADLRRIEQVLKRTGLAPNQLDHMFHEEVAPVCMPNLHSVAGVWSGFDPDWLVAEIESYQRKPVIFRKLRTSLRARAIRRMVPEWAEILARLTESG